MTKILVTGAAGFIGFHMCRYLLEAKHEVFGLDGLTDYYDVELKKARLAQLEKYSNFSFDQSMLGDIESLDRAFDSSRPEVVIHLAAQAGVRHSIAEPRAYLVSNIIGTFNVMEASKRLNVQHLLMASSSSVYGTSQDTLLSETTPSDTSLSMYAATKKANECMGHSYANIHGLPTTMLRFFTAYGPWGRPDMALFKFTKAILADEPITLFNHGKMYRDFTYIDDVVQSISLLITKPPESKEIVDQVGRVVPPFRVVNIGNSRRVSLLEFVDALEEKLGKKADIKYEKIQPGDVEATQADTTLLKDLTGFTPQTHLRDGIAAFADWYVGYYGAKENIR